MITGPYDLNTIEEAFDVALRLDLTFKILVNLRSGILNVRDMDIMIISVLQRVNMLELCLVMKLTS